MAAKKQNKRNVKLRPKREPWLFASLWRWLKLACISLSVSAIIALGLFYGAKVSQQFLAKPIAHIAVEGEFYYIDKQVVEALVAAQIKGSFIREKLGAVQSRLEQHPWIDSVVLSRQWPDLLYVKVVEQRPIAKWGNAGFVNYRGELFHVDDAERLNALPVIYGNNGNTLGLMKQYQTLSEVLRPYGLTITVLQESELGIWTFELNNDWQFIAGRDDIVKKLQRVMTMLATNKIRRQDEINRIDMRYQNGLAISWKNDQQHAQNPNNNSFFEQKENI